MDLSDYKLVWEDAFDGSAGSKPDEHWFFFDGWGAGKWRDAYYTDSDAYLDGAGHLVIRSRIEGEKFETSYLQTYDWKVPASRWTTFGPGQGKYIETRVDFSGLQAQGPWIAFWLFDPRNPYDGDPHNGTEIDIMEYVVADGLRDKYHVANHWGPLEATWGHEVKLPEADVYRIDLREGWHTFGLQWAADKLTYYLDGKPVFTTPRGVSTSDGQALMLTVEYQRGPGDPWNINKNVLDDAALLPDYFLVDYVRVYERQSSPPPAGTESEGTGSTMFNRSAGKMSGDALGFWACRSPASWPASSACWSWPCCCFGRFGATYTKLRNRCCYRRSALLDRTNKVTDDSVIASVAKQSKSGEWIASSLCSSQ